MGAQHRPRRQRLARRERGGSAASGLLRPDESANRVVSEEVADDPAVPLRADDLGGTQVTQSLGHVWAAALAYWKWGNVEARWTSTVPAAPAERHVAGPEPAGEQ
jgi:hypothetical protein